MMWNCGCFFSAYTDRYNNVSDVNTPRGSVATHLMIGGIFVDEFNAHSLLNVLVAAVA